MSGERSVKNYFWCHFLALRLLGLDFYFASPNNTKDRIFNTLRLLYNIIVQVLIVFGYTILEIIQAWYLINEKERLMTNLAFTVNHLISLLKALFFIRNRDALKHMADVLEFVMLKYRQDEESLKNTIRISITIMLVFCGIVSGVCTCGTSISVADTFVFIEGVNSTINVTTYLPYEVIIFLCIKLLLQSNFNCIF